MKYLRETTAWEGLDYNVPAHIYAIDNRGWCLGYIKAVTTRVEWFSEPMKNFDRRGRSFEDVTKWYKGTE